MALVAGSPEATPWAKAPSVASRAFCAALHPALGASSTPAPAVRAERTKVRRSMRLLMATPIARCARGQRALLQGGHKGQRLKLLSWMSDEDEDLWEAARARTREDVRQIFAGIPDAPHR